MLDDLALGGLLVVVTMFVHAAFMVVAVRRLKIGSRKAGTLVSPIRRATLVTSLVLIMFFAALVESGIWALSYVVVGAIPGFEEAIYFSTVTFTTLGFGDIVIHNSWRLLAGLQAATGTIVFGWTTALIVTAAHYLYFHRQGSELDTGDEP
jgi:hypothetical protein